MQQNSRIQSCSCLTRGLAAPTANLWIYSDWGWAVFFPHKDGGRFQASELEPLRRREDATSSQSKQMTPSAWQSLTPANPLEFLLLTPSFRPTFTHSTAWRRSPYWSPSRIHSFRVLFLMTTRVVFGNKRALGHSRYKYFQPQMVQPSRVSSNKCDFDNGAQSQFPGVVVLPL